MATHSRILAWRIPWTEEPGGWATGHGGPKELDMTECLSAQPLLLISSVVILRHCRVLRRFCEFSRLRHEWPEKEAMAAGGGCQRFPLWLDPDCCRSHFWPHFCFHFGHSESFNNHRGIKDPASDRSPREHSIFSATGLGLSEYTGAEPRVMFCQLPRRSSAL